MSRNKTHYRVLRSTVVLARQSVALKQVITPELQSALDLVKHKNYQFDQIDADTLELLFASFDEDFTNQVRDEYTFFPDSASVRVHARACAVCELCGKGDSKETGDNRDHLRFEFCLRNTQGGKDTWCGSTCIVNFGLKVDGAATAEEAERLLGQSMRSAIRQFNIEAWRASNPDHEHIQEQYQALRRSVKHAERFVRDCFGELELAGFDGTKVEGMRGLVNRMRVAVNFYHREAHLTPKKQQAWTATKRALDGMAEIQTLLDDARDIRDPEKRFEHFANIGNADTITNTPDTSLEKSTNVQAA